MLDADDVIHIQNLTRSTKFHRRRDQLLSKLTKDATVLHIGACDAPYHIEKAKEGKLLQQCMAKTARQVIGVDVDEAAISDLRDLGIKNIYTYSDLPKMSYDIAICGETIEHISNFDLFFKELRELDFDKIVFTTPNSYFYGSIFRAIKRREFHHPDHKMIFSPHLLAQLLKRYGFDTEAIYTTFLERKLSGKRGIPAAILSRILPLFPLFGETLVVVARR